LAPLKSDLTWLSQSPFPIRVFVFVAILLALWSPVAVPAYFFFGHTSWVAFVTLPVLYSAFLWLANRWGRQVYHQSRLLRHYGFHASLQMVKEGLLGLAIGVGSLGFLFLTQGWLGWLSWNAPTLGLLRIGLEGLLVALAIAVAEELLFRGWLLDELERDYSPAIALGLNATLFAALHFVKPVPEMIRTFPQFPGLMLLAAALVWAKRSRQGRLGLAIGLHAGLVWGYYLVKVGQLTQLTGRVPAWVTGIDHNPLAGAIGLLFLTLLGLGLGSVVWLRKSSPG